MQRLQLLKKDKEIHIINANHYFLRLRGLIGRKLNDSNGLLLDPCDQIHTFFMKFPIDVIFLSAENKVLHIDEQVVPNQIGKRVKGAKKVLELKGGISNKISIHIGDILVMEKCKGNAD